MEMTWVNQLSSNDQEILHRISTYFLTDISFVEKLRRARLIALLDQEYDPLIANSGHIKAMDVLRVTNYILSNLSSYER